MKYRRLLLCLLSAAASWQGTALYRQWWHADTHRFAPAQETVAAPSRDAALEALQKLRPAAGTAELSRITALIASVPGRGTAALSEAGFGSALGEGEAGALWNAIGALPPGTARDVAFSFLNARDRHQDSPETDRSPLKEEAGAPQDNSQRALEETLKTGVAGEAGGEWEMTLKEWLRGDPGTALAAVKAMPAGEGRTAAVNAAMAYTAKTDPAGALAFFLQSGEPKAGAGAAVALAQLLIDPPSGNEGTRNGQEFLARLSAEQRETLTFNLAVELHNDRDGTLLHDGHLVPLAKAVLQLNAAGMQDFFQELARFPNDAEEMRRFIDSAAALGQSPGAAQARDALDRAKIEAEVESGEAAGRFLAGAWGDRISPSSKTDPNAIVERHAPAMVSSLVRTGRLPEALQVLDRLHDPEAWSASFQTLLPSWMDADPKAARAAFNAAPLTALERERLQRSPAFLLHP